MSDADRNSPEGMRKSWTGSDTRGALAFAAEAAGFAFLFAASSLPYKAIGGLLVVAGIFLWGGPRIREAIARERVRANRRS